MKSNNGGKGWGLRAVCFLTIALISTVLKAELELTSETWSNDKDDQVSLTSFESRIRVLSLFYTDCPNTCSLTIEKYKQLDEIFQNRNIPAEFILMSLDPENDTPAALEAYRAERDLRQENWHFLTSTEQQVRAIAKKLGYRFTRLDDHVFHRMKVFIVDSDNNVTDVVKMNTDLEKLSLLNE